MRVLFFGIYQVGVEALVAIAARQLNIVGVVTKPNTTAERQPVADVAQRLGLPLLAPTSPREPAFQKQIEALAPDLIAVAGYHLVLPKPVLELPRAGVINMHPSLLPRYRGPCPWKWVIACGEAVTGVSVARMTGKLDAGDILVQVPTPIGPDETGEDLFLRLSALGGPILANAIAALQAGALSSTPQDEKLATYHSAPTAEDARIVWADDAAAIRNRIRGFHPRPGSWTVYEGAELNVRRASLLTWPAEGAPGTIVNIDADAMQVATGSGILTIEDLTPRDGRQIPRFTQGTMFV